MSGNPDYKADLDKATAALGKYFGVLSKDDFLGKLVALENLDSTAIAGPDTFGGTAQQVRRLSTF